MPVSVPRRRRPAIAGMQKVTREDGIRCLIGSNWTRRAKVPLADITWPLIRAALAKAGARLEARYDDTGKDGGPACATVKLANGWRVANE